MTAANAVEEAKQEGGDLGIPYWRTLKADGYLNEKFPGGVDAHKALLEVEGVTVVRKGKRCYVVAYQDVLFRDFEQFE